MLSLSKQISFFIFLLSLLLSCHAYGLSGQQEKFIQMILKKVSSVNSAIQKDRRHLDQLHQKFLTQISLSNKELTWLSKTASYYKVSTDFTRSDTWDSLENRVDIVPPSLALAQSIYETNWGKSRFAREGNNYFGQYCYTIGCGLIPKQRKKSATFEVRRFSSAQESVNVYIHNINTNRAYKKIRQLRSEQRKAGKKIDGLTLSVGLKYYAEQGHYVKSIQTLINKYHLSQYDVKL